jgi:hypothetical protein
MLGGVAAAQLAEAADQTSEIGVARLPGLPAGHPLASHVPV